MIFCVFIAKKSYSIQRYLFVTLIVAAVAMFILESKKGDLEPTKVDQNLGIYLVLTSLVLDGFTGALQESLRSKAQPSTSEFMFKINYWSFFILICVMSVTGEGRDFMKFAKEYPLVLAHIALGVFVGVFAQFFLNAILAEFGSLSLSLVTTTRKFLNVLLSVIWYSNKLSIIQWVSALVVFGCLILDSIFGKKTKSKPDLESSEDMTSVTSISQQSQCDPKKPQLGAV